MKERAVFYARVSTEEEEQMQAIEKQIEENRKVIEERGWLLTGEYVDRGVTGTQATKRSEYMRLLEDVRKDMFDIIVVKDQSRLQRNTLDWYLFINEVLSHNIKLFFYLENSFFSTDDKFLYGIKAMMSEEYSRDLSKKGNSAARRRQKSGKPIITNNTWGYKNVAGEIKIDNAESPMIQEIFNLFAKGYGGRVVARILRDSGIRNRKGNTLSENTIREIVKNPLYRGVVVMNKEHFDFETKKIIKNPENQWIYREGLVPRIVSDELWFKANEQLNKRKTVDRTHNVGINKGNNLLSSKIYCGECGSKYWRNKRKEAIYWYCSEGSRSGKVRERTGNKCVTLNLKEDEILGILGQIGKAFVNDTEQREILNNALERIISALIGQKTVNTESIHNQIERLEKSKQDLLEFLLDGTIEKKDYKIKQDGINEKINRLEEQLISNSTVEEKNKKIRERIEGVKDLLMEAVEHNTTVPLMCSHLEQIRVFENRMDIYLNVVGGTQCVPVKYHEGQKEIMLYDVPMRLGGVVPG